VLSSLKQRQAGPGAAVAAPLDRFVQQSRDTQRLVQREIEQLQAGCDRVAESRTRLSQLREMSNPYSAAVQQLQRQLETQQQELDTQQQQQDELEGKVGCCSFLLDVATVLAVAFHQGSRAYLAPVMLSQGALMHPATCKVILSRQVVVDELLVLS
jgi:DNA repair ATPase RecN